MNHLVFLFFILKMKKSSSSNQYNEPSTFNEKKIEVEKIAFSRGQTYIVDKQNPLQQKTLSKSKIFFIFW